jgi:hypothetical protein
VNKNLTNLNQTIKTVALTSGVPPPQEANICLACLNDYEYPALQKYNKKHESRLQMHPLSKFLRLLIR